ncbi:hypothetical protein GALMADRAFT_132750 [Galerina marginata CBS 339.88]|uniref:Uncharacterized protein n=1 Tax=Galerina marginata (strain CBS 339.88) TaxID=685588 RepID=A0A067TSK6_GALM3|nr:hypothetical protein GALMADRAFT_132750 [Galerina marginata CBS 339.88]
MPVRKTQPARFLVVLYPPFYERDDLYAELVVTKTWYFNADGTYSWIGSSFLMHTVRLACFSLVYSVSVGLNISSQVATSGLSYSVGVSRRSLEHLFAASALGWCWKRGAAPGMWKGWKIVLVPGMGLGWAVTGRDGKAVWSLPFLYAHYSIANHHSRPSSVLADPVASQVSTPSQSASPSTSRTANCVRSPRPDVMGTSSSGYRHTSCTDLAIFRDLYAGVRHLPGAHVSSTAHHLMLINFVNRLGLSFLPGFLVE